MGGMDGGLSSMIVGAVSFIGSSILSYSMAPKSPSMDMTNYDLLRQTQDQANAESDAAKARMEEARKREELRQQQMFAQDIKTSETGADVDKVGVTNQVLGKADEKDEEL